MVTVGELQRSSSGTTMTVAQTDFRYTVLRSQLILIITEGKLKYVYQSFILFRDEISFESLLFPACKTSQPILFAVVYRVLVFLLTVQWNSQGFYKPSP